MNVNTILDSVSDTVCPALEDFAGSWLTARLAPLAEDAIARADACIPGEEDQRDGFLRIAAALQALAFGPARAV